MLAFQYPNGNATNEDKSIFVPRRKSPSIMSTRQKYIHQQNKEPHAIG